MTKASEVTMTDVKFIAKHRKNQETTGDFENEDIIEFNKELRENPEIDHLFLEYGERTIMVDLEDGEITLNDVPVVSKSPKSNDYKWINFKRTTLSLVSDGSEPVDTFAYCIGWERVVHDTILKRYIMIREDGSWLLQKEDDTLESLKEEE